MPSFRNKVHEKGHPYSGCPSCIHFLFFLLSSSLRFLSSEALMKSANVPPPELSLVANALLVDSSLRKSRLSLFLSDLSGLSGLSNLSDLSGLKSLRDL